MDKDFRDRLSFNGPDLTSFQRENWHEYLMLLSHLTLENIPSPELPSILDIGNQTTYVEWVITEESRANCIFLVPYFVDGITSYKIPSFNHLLNNIPLSSFDHAWSIFFADNFDKKDDIKIVLNTEKHINEILWSLARAKRLRMANDTTNLATEQPLQFKARLRYSGELDLWTLDAELMSQNGEIIEPESLDFITQSGIVVYDRKLFTLPKGAAWIVQLLVSGPWYIAKKSLSEALYKLAHCIQDSEFLRDLSIIKCIPKTPLPVVYLRAKHFEKQTPITFYLAYKYENCEVFSKWHNQDESNTPIGFEVDNSESCILYFRDQVYEKETELLINHQPGMTFINNKRVWIVNIDTLWQLIHILLRQGWEIWAEKHKIEELSSFSIDTKSNIGWFELYPLDAKTKQIIDPLQLIKYLKRKALFIQLGQGRVCVLPERWIERLTQFLDIGKSEDANNSWCFSSMYAATVDEIIGDEPEFQADAAFHDTVNKMRSFSSIVNLEQPEGLRAILRPYQLEGLTWLNLLCELNLGGILADDMGLGKTVQILALVQHRIVNQENISPKTILVVCPKSVQGHWLLQVNNLLPRLSCNILNSRHILTGFKNSNQHQILLVSYGVVRHHIKSLSAWKFDLLILDEAQMIKNTLSQTTQAIKQLCATQRFALTGTPIENSFTDLVSIFNFLNPYAQLSLCQSSSAADALRDLVQRALHPFVLRRLKEDVLSDLPLKTMQEITLAMEPDQGQLYYELLEIYRTEIAKHKIDHELPTESDTAFFLEGLLRLRQVATHPQQLISNSLQKCSSNKLKYLTEQIPTLIENGHRIVIFSQFLEFLKDLSSYINEINIRHIYVDGETTDRDNAIAFFQSNLTIKVLLISLRVGGVGIDLTNADVCIIADPWWNDAVEKQAIDRLHRFGQKKAVQVLRLISKDSIEEKIGVLKRNKNELVDALGKTTPDFLNNLKWNDFTEIF